MMPKQMKSIGQEAVILPANSLATDCTDIEDFFLSLQDPSILKITITPAKIMANIILNWAPAHQNEAYLVDNLFALALKVFSEYEQCKQRCLSSNPPRVDNEEFEECDKLVAKWTSPSNILPPIALKAAFDAEVRHERTRQPAGLCLHCLRGGDDGAWTCHRQPSPHS